VLVMTTPKSDPPQPALPYLIAQMQLALGFDWPIGTVPDMQLNCSLSAAGEAYRTDQLELAMLDAGIPKAFRVLREARERGEWV
jgi:hypothetical protein